MTKKNEAFDGRDLESPVNGKHLLLLFWKSAAGFWSERGARLSRVLSGSLILIILFNLATSFGMNVWNRLFFDALQTQESRTALLLAALYLPLLMASVLLSVTQVCARMTIQRQWRAWLNNFLMDRWLTRGRYFHLNIASNAPRNPEYRLADDVRVATESPIEFAIGATTAILSAATFVIVLWTIGGALTIHWNGAAITIPGFLVVAAVVYAAAASGLMLVIGRNFVAVSESKNSAEAEYRYILTRLRENGESIALLRGEGEERVGVDRSFTAVLCAWRELCFQYMRTTFISQTSGYVTPILPIILCAPKFLEGSMSLGEVMQAASAFTIVQAAFNWLVDNYPRLAEWAASARRVAAMQASLDHLDRAETRCGRIVQRECWDRTLRLRDVSITLGDGTSVLSRTQLEVKRGEKVLITGASGSGKSTLVRALAGVWPWGEGGLEIAAGAKLLVLPQRPYVPTGTLRRAATYPDAADSRSREEIVATFNKVGLTRLAERLDEEGPWDQTLSGGEKQRLGFARILLHRPDIIVLDEATAALDSASQSSLMQSVMRELSDPTIISIAHRSDLELFHDRRMVLQRTRDGATLVRDWDREPKRIRSSYHAGYKVAVRAQHSANVANIREPMPC